MKSAVPADRNRIKHRAIWPRFRDAFCGAYQAYREEPNLRFHVFATTCVGLAAYAVQLRGWEIAYLAVSVLAVLLAEMFNTAVERTIDLATGGRRMMLAAHGKQIAAGAVLLAAGHATFAAIFLFAVQRGLVTTVEAVAQLARRSPWVLFFPIVTGVVGLFGGKEMDVSE